MNYSFADYQKDLELAQQAATAYYADDTSGFILSDAEYDILVRRVKTAEEENPTWGKSAVTTQVAAGVGAGSIVHSKPMLSLDNALDIAELDVWVQKVKTAIPDATFCVEPKFDGLALSLKYTSGRLDIAATRGDGTQGEDVTANVRKAAVGAPVTLVTHDTVEVRGEAVLTNVQFETANKIRAEGNKGAFANARNAMGGILRTIHSEPVPFTFYAYEVVGLDFDSADDQREWLSKNGFRIESSTYATSETISAVVADFQSQRSSRQYGTDGAVVKVASAAHRRLLGEGSRAPKWAIAFKFPPEEQATILKDIEVAVGRSGALTLTGVLEPVEIAGSTVSRVTLHNVNDIRARDIRIGDRVLVVKSGDVIPRVHGVLTAYRQPESQPYAGPSVCPNCGRDWDKQDVVWKCASKGGCSKEKAVVYAVSRDCLDIEGLGEGLVARLFDQGLLTGLEDLFSLAHNKHDLEKLLGPKVTENVLAEIEKAKQAPLHRVFCALGIPLTGRRMSRLLAATFSSIERIMSASQEELSALNSIGDVKAAKIVEGIRTMSPVIAEWKKNGVAFTPQVPDATPILDNPVKGKKVLITGSIPGHNRDQAQELVRSLGGTPASSVSKTLDLLIEGDGAAPAKVSKAKELGITIQNSAWLLEL